MCVCNINLCVYIAKKSLHRRYCLHTNTALRRLRHTSAWHTQLQHKHQPTPMEILYRNDHARLAASSRDQAHHHRPVYTLVQSRPILAHETFADTDSLQPTGRNPFAPWLQDTRGISKMLLVSPVELTQSGDKHKVFSDAGRVAQSCASSFQHPERLFVFAIC